jgi:hypothetical protein
VGYRLNIIWNVVSVQPLSKAKALGPEMEIWTFVRVSKLVQFVLLRSTSQGGETD